MSCRMCGMPNSKGSKVARCEKDLIKQCSTAYIGLTGKMCSRQLSDSVRENRLTVCRITVSLDSWVKIQRLTVWSRL